MNQVEKKGKMLLDLRPMLDSYLNFDESVGKKANEENKKSILATEKSIWKVIRWY